ncbi:MAG: ATP synthase subunit I [Zoogloea sp.]|jgi:ATP synthase protein I|uniref:ATP synthase subunit I n=1 Tax=Pseudomonadota TaxID=1224 RepID=UPI001B52F274|nr:MULTISPECIES: ATP synthase subunit I [Pseudomonadota]MBP7392811.1 ATP synthase subunit I [Zoogloea sp.]
MIKAVYLQIGATILVAMIAGLVIGERGAVSAALGGAACVLPNFLFALRLHAVSKRPAASYPLEFFVGEFFKIASTVGLLVTVQLVYPDVHWLALFIGLVVALKANLFAFLVKT